jgi:hypothetical protein
MKSQQIENPNYIQYIDELVRISIRGLNDLFIQEKEEFAEKKILQNNALIYEGTNTRYTLICLIGLHKAVNHDIEISITKKIDLNTILNKQIEKLHHYVSVGDIGLLIWATALISPEEIASLIPKINFNNILTSYSDAKLKTTMELSWLLTGILIASAFNEAFNKSVGSLPLELFKIIRNNYGGKGIFKHQSNESFIGKLRGNISTFADQVYPIYAFVLFSHKFENEEALLIAEQTALKLCELQGKNGEWMWHYNSDNGKVLSDYPVYSVHQDAMAPIALYAIQKATNKSYEKYIFKGLDWLSENILNFDMVSKEHNTIWRGIIPDNNYRKIRTFFSIRGFSTNNEFKNLKIWKECWSYHLGWLLYAYAGRVENSKNEFKNNDLKIYNFNKIQQLN